MMSNSAEEPQTNEAGRPIADRVRNIFHHEHARPSKPHKVVVITNPAAGQDQPFLKPVNAIFRAADLIWEISLTMEGGDGQRLAKKAVAEGADIVVAFGGDGTVVDVASGLIGTQVPLGILPGGTSNMMSRAFGIPQDIEAAATLIANLSAHKLYPVFIGKAGENYFQQLVGIGMEAQIIEGADRSAKDRLGFFAYVLAGLRALGDPQNAHYRIELDDGQVVEDDGVTCLVAKVGNLGIPSLEQSATTADSDQPLMDIVVIRQVDLPSLLSLAGTVVSGNENPEKLPHWQARRVTVTSDPVQTVQADGELIGKTPISVEVLHPPIQLIVPPETVDKKQELKTNSQG
jgi:diacylglycerol kinase (ATP)